MLLARRDEGELPEVPQGVPTVPPLHHQDGLKQPINRDHGEDGPVPKQHNDLREADQLQANRPSDEVRDDASAIVDLRGGGQSDL